LVFAAKFSLGDTVEVINTGASGLVVRDAPAGNAIGKKYDGSRGMVLAGPQSASLGGVVYTWWKVRWGDDALEGWSAEGYPGGVDYLRKISISPSTKFSIGDFVKVYNTGGSLIVRTDPPALSYKDSEVDGTFGKVEGGPFYGVAAGTPGFYYFWKVNYGSVVGWSAENWLMKATPSDLTVEDIWIDPASFNPGSTITIYWRIKNIGASAAVSDQGLLIKAYFDGALYHQEGIEGLGAGYAYTSQHSYTWPSDANSHTIKVEVDPSNYIIESNENNNIRSESFQASAPDLIVDDIWVDPDPPSPGGLTTWGIRIKNQGAGDATGTFFLECYFDNTYVGHVYVYGLSAGSTYTSYWQAMTWPSDTNPHTIKGVVDPDNKIIESNENNNVRSESFQATAPPQFGFTVGVSPSSGSAQQGGSVSATVTVTLTSGPTQTVSLTTSGLPSGAYATFNPSSGYPTFTSTITISTSTTTPTGTFYITIIGSGGGLTRTATYALTVNPLLVPDFSISASPTSLTIQQGSSGSSTITITSINGFNQPVQLSVSGAPSGVTATLSPSQVTPPAGGTATSTLTVSVSTTATPGNYPLTVTGTNGTITHNVNIPLEITTLVIFEPQLSIPVYAPIDQQAHSGTILTFIINVANLGTVTDTVELSVSDTLNWNIQLSETSVTLGPNQSTDVYLNVTIEGYDQNDEITIRGRSQGDNSKTSSCQVKAVTSGEGNGLFNVWLKFSNKDTQDHTLSFDAPDYVKLSSKSILLNPLELELLYVVFDPKWYDIHTEPGLNSFSIHVVDFATAKGARIPIKFDEYLVRTTNFDLTEDSYNFANYFYKDDTCYGMAATAIVYFNNPELLYEKYGKLTTYSLTEKEAIDEILRYQDSWENIKTASFSLNLWPNEGEEYSKLKSEILDWGHPMVLALKIGGKDLHAVVAYKIVEKGDKAYILVYDPDHNYAGLSNILAFRYATYDLTTHELYYYGVKCTFIVREAKEPTLTFIGEGVRWKTRQVERAKTWLGQVASWIRSGFHAIFECSVNVTIVDQYGRIISDNGTNQIPNAFIVFGNETKYFCLPSDLSYNFSISAYDVGNFTLMIVRPVANNNAALDLYENVPVKPGTQVTLEVVLYQMNQTMKIDYDGDGVIDESRNTDVSSLFPLPVSSVFVYEILINGQVFLLYIESNSTISDFTFIQMDKEVNFNVTGPDGSFGFCNVTVPKALLYGEPWTVLIDGAPVSATITENATHSFLYFTYAHSTHLIQIIGTWVIAPPPPPTYSLTITTTVGGTTDPAPGTYTYTANSPVQVTAIPNADYIFDHWELDTVNIGSANPYTVLMDNNHTLRAVFTYSPPPPSLSASISPLSASILVSQSVTFTSTVSGGYTPYTYQWYLNSNPVSGATSDTWAFTPTACGIYHVYLNVTDGKGNTIQSETAQITATLLGDLNGDGKVDIKDIAIVAQAFGETPEQPRWNPIADINKDDKIDIRDIAIVAKNFGKTCT
jgi:hypothetical protein